MGLIEFFWGMRSKITITSIIHLDSSWDKRTLVEIFSLHQHYFCRLLQIGEEREENIAKNFDNTKGWKEMLNELSISGSFKTQNIELLFSALRKLIILTFLEQKSRLYYHYYFSSAVSISCHCLPTYYCTLGNPI